MKSPAVAVPPAAVPPMRGSGTTGEAPAAAPAGTARNRPGRTTGRGPRRARLQLRHIDTWSALKISLVLSIALFFLLLVMNALAIFIRNRYQKRW